jgi:hypothetical protein
MRDRSKVNWEAIRGEVLKGGTVAAVAAKHGTTHGRVAMRAQREGWDIQGARRVMLQAAVEGKEVEVEVEALGARIRGSSFRSKVAMAEEVERVLRELRETAGMGALARSRCLASLVGVCEKLYRWDEEPTLEELGRMKNAAVNIRLIRTTPEQLRLMAKRKGGVVEGEAGGMGRQSQEASGYGSGALEH